MRLLQYRKRDQLPAVRVNHGAGIFKLIPQTMVGIDSDTKGFRDPFAGQEKDTHRLLGWNSGWIVTSPTSQISI